MDPADIGLFNLAERRLAWADAREKLLAENIANADTPGAHARDLAPFAAQLGRAQLAPMQTSPMHLAGLQLAATDIQARPDQQAVDGNAISVEDELTKVADTDNTHQLVTNIYHKYMSMFMTALDKG